MSQEHKNILKCLKFETKVSDYGIIMDIKLSRDNYVDCLYTEGACVLFKDNPVVTKNPYCIYRQYSPDEKSIFMICKKASIYTIERWETGGKLLEVLFSFQNGNIDLYDFSTDCNFIVFTDKYYIKLCNLLTREITTIYVSAERINCVKISKDNSIVVFTLGKDFMIFDTNTLEIKKIQCSKYSSIYYNLYMEDIYIYDDLSIKIGTLYGTILLFKDGKLSEIKDGNCLLVKCKFSNDGKMLTLYNPTEDETIILSHEENFDNCKIIIDFDHLCLSRNSKLLITSKWNKLNIYDISDIGNLRRNQISTFLTILEKDKSQTLCDLKNNCLFDINVVRIIFDFLPIRTENFKIKFM